MFDNFNVYLKLIIIGLLLGLIFRIYKQSGEKFFLGTLLLAFITIPIFYVSLIVAIIPGIIFLLKERKLLAKLIVGKVYDSLDENIKRKNTKEEICNKLIKRWYHLIWSLFKETIFSIDDLTNMLIEFDVHLLRNVSNSHIEISIRFGIIDTISEFLNRLVTIQIDDFLFAYKKA